MIKMAAGAQPRFDIPASASINGCPSRQGKRIVVSTHPRTRKRIETIGASFHEKVEMMKPLGVPAVQLVNTPGISRKATGKGEGILIASADRWLAGLP